MQRPAGGGVRPRRGGHRAQQLETGQATTLDKTLFDLHADLVSSLANYDSHNDLRFNALMKQFRRVLDQLPTPAGRGEINVYFRTLIRQLGTDPWLQDRRLGGH